MSPLKATRRVVAVMTGIALSAVPATAHAGVEQGEFGYHQGASVFFVSASVVIGAQPELLAHSSQIYLLAFSAPAGTEGPITLPSGYRPQENGNFAAPLPFHDHVLPFVPGEVGYRALMQVVVLRYTSTYQQSPGFRPVTSMEGIAAGEAAGIFQVVAPGTADPYQRWVDDVLIRPVVSS